MKIICQSCKKIIGEIEPLKDARKSKAKCSDCLKVEKDAEIKRLIEIPLKSEKTKDRVVTFENGAQGFLTIAGKETKKLGIWGVLFEGKEFFCCDETRKDFEKHLASLSNDEVDVTFLYSLEIFMDPKSKGRKKKQQLPEEPTKREPIEYNCTVRGTKDFARHVFESKEGQFKDYLDIVWPVVQRLYKEEQQLKTVAQNPAPGLSSTSSTL